MVRPLSCPRVLVFFVADTSGRKKAGLRGTGLKESRRKAAPAAEAAYTNVPLNLDCHCEERSDEAIHLDRHGALRTPRDDKSLKAEGRWYYATRSTTSGGGMGRLGARR